MFINSKLRSDCPVFDKLAKMTQTKKQVEATMLKEVTTTIVRVRESRPWSVMRWIAACSRSYEKKNGRRPDTITLVTEWAKRGKSKMNCLG